MTCAGALILYILFAAAAHHRAEGEELPIGFAFQFVDSISQEPDVPQRFAFFCHEDGISWAQVYHRIEENHAKGKFLFVSDDLSARQLVDCPVAGFTLHILNLCLAAVQIAIPHNLLARVTVDAIQSPLAAHKLGDGLVIIVHAVSGGVIPRMELHIPQIIITPVVTGIAL